MGLGNFAKMAALAAGLALATPAAAQQAISLDAGEPYVHPHSGIEVPARLTEVNRTRAIEFSESALDVAMVFDTSSDALSIYIFRNTNGAVPVWFAQAQVGVETRDIYNSPSLAFPLEAFTPPGQTHASGLQAIYAVDGGPYASTGLAVFAVDEWYVKIRASSTTRTPQQLRVWIGDAIDGLTLPAGNSPAVQPIENCSEELRFRGRARDVEGDIASNVLEGLLGGVLEGIVREGRSESDAPPTTWCRDSELTPVQVVYRANRSNNAYLLAISDSGNGVAVGPVASIDGLLEDQSGEDSDPAYAVRMITAGRTYNFVSQDRLPRPRRVMQLLEQNRITGSVTTWGDERNVEINADALSDSKASLKNNAVLPI